MPDLSPEQLLDRIRDAIRSGLDAFTHAEQDYPRTGDPDQDRVGLLAFQLGALHNTVLAVADLLGIEPSGGAA